jgi:hypothetical protein
MKTPLIIAVAVVAVGFITTLAAVFINAGNISREEERRELEEQLARRKAEKEENKNLKESR